MQGSSSHQPRGALALALTLGVLAAFLPGLCLAQPIAAESLEGPVQYRESADADWQPIKAGTALALPLEIKTGEHGQASLRQFGVSLELKPLTHLVLTGADGGAKGPVSNISQQLGTVFYRIENHPGDLRVETPFLRATVDGTEFIVVATASDSFVTLTEGQLEVAVRGTQESRSLAPGEVARVSGGQAGIDAFHDAPARSSSGATDDSALQLGAVESESAMADSFEITLAQINEMATTQAGQAIGPEEPASGDDGGGFDQGPGDVDGGLGDDDMPNDDQGPGDDDMPNDDQGPGDDDMPNDDQGPSDDDMPNDDQGPGEDDMPDDGQDPGNDDMPNDDEDHGGDDRGDKHCHIIFCHDHPGGWGKGEGEGRGHNKGD